jgi:predicted Zn-dependent peptidase
LGRSLEDIANIPARVQAVTPADIQRVAERYFDFSKAFIVSVMPK